MWPRIWSRYEKGGRVEKKSGEEYLDGMGQDREEEENVRAYASLFALRDTALSRNVRAINTWICHPSGRWFSGQRDTSFVVTKVQAYTPGYDISYWCCIIDYTDNTSLKMRLLTEVGPIQYLVYTMPRVLDIKSKPHNHTMHKPDKKCRRTEDRRAERKKHIQRKIEAAGHTFYFPPHVFGFNSGWGTGQKRSKAPGSPLFFGIEYRVESSCIWLE